MAKVSVRTSTPAVTISPLARIVRTFSSVIVALLGAIPTLSVFLHLSASRSAEFASIVGAVILIVAVILNTLEHLGVLSTAGGKVPASAVLAAEKALLPHSPEATVVKDTEAVANAIPSHTSSAPAGGAK